MVKAADRDDLSFHFMEAFNDICIGAYEILGRLEDVPLNVPESDSVTYDVQVMLDGMAKTQAMPLVNMHCNPAVSAHILINRAIICTHHAFVPKKNAKKLQQEAHGILKNL